MVPSDGDFKLLRLLWRFGKVGFEVFVLAFVVSGIGHRLGGWSGRETWTCGNTSECTSVTVVKHAFVFS